MQATGDHGSDARTRSSTATDSAKITRHSAGRAAELLFVTMSNNCGQPMSQDTLRFL
jgi:hypothetical protein